RDPFSRCWILELRPLSKFRAASLAHVLAEVAREIGEEKEWPFFSPLLAHVQHWDRRAEQQNGGQEFYSSFRCERGKPLTERAVADLVVVLEKIDERCRGELCARVAVGQSVAIGGWLALVDEALRQSSREFCGDAFRVVPIITLGVACRENMRDVME